MRWLASWTVVGPLSAECCSRKLYIVLARNPLALKSDVRECPEWVLGQQHHPGRAAGARACCGLSGQRRLVLCAPAQPIAFLLLPPGAQVIAQLTKRHPHIILVPLALLALLLGVGIWGVRTRERTSYTDTRYELYGHRVRHNQRGATTRCSAVLQSPCALLAHHLQRHGHLGSECCCAISQGRYQPGCEPAPAAWRHSTQQPQCDTVFETLGRHSSLVLADSTRVCCVNPACHTGVHYT